MTDVWHLIEQERLALADLLESLTPAELATRSLCGEWTVQEVASHIAWANTVGLRTLVREVARDGFHVNRTSARLAKSWALRGPEAVVARLRDFEDSRHLTPGTRPVDVLADFVTHQLDVRVPLGKERAAPVEASQHALSAYVRMGFPLHIAFGRNPKATGKGLHLVATDAGWSHGDGPEVSATSSALIRALTGRPVGRAELDGTGADVLFARLG